MGGKTTVRASFNFLGARLRMIFSKRIKGYVDRIDRDQVVGWVWRPRTPNVAVEVELVSNGKVWTRTLADGYRDDLKASGIGDGRHAFEIPLPAEVDPDSVVVRLADTKQLLPPRARPSHATPDSGNLNGIDSQEIREQAGGTDTPTHGFAAEPPDGDIDAWRGEMRSEPILSGRATIVVGEGQDWTGMRIESVSLVNLTDPPTHSSQRQLEQLRSLLGWDSTTYLKMHKDLGAINRRDGHIKLLAHFLSNGISERRQFSKTIDFAKKFFFDASLQSENFLLVPGWSETPLSDPKVIIQCTDSTYAIVPSEHINYWRDDVAKHLGTSLRDKPHGFILLMELPEGLSKREIRLVVRDANQMLVGSISPQSVRLEEFVQAAFRILQGCLSYEEMVRTFDEHYRYLEFLRRPLQMVHAEAPTEFRYGTRRDESNVDLTVCAVLLGRGVLLKPFFTSLMSHHPKRARWEILLLANSELDIENIKSAAGWCSEVFGIEVKVFSHRNNLGFGGGMNFLVSRARGQITAISNTDLRFTQFDANEIEEEVRGGTVILAAYQFNPWGSLQHEGLVHDRRTTLVNGRLIEILDTRLLGRNTYPEHLPRKEVEYFGAACLVADTKLFQSLGPFSTDYFYAYHEDCDLARRARLQGIRSVLSPALRVVHYESSGTEGVTMPLSAINAANLVTFMKGDVNLGESAI